MSIETQTRKLDLPLAKLDDWDLLQAAFEASVEEIGSRPGFDIEAILEKEFPHNQPKLSQENRIKVMLSQKNEWSSMTAPYKVETPTEILADALNRILNESRLSQRKTIRQLIRSYLDTRIDPHSEARPASPRCPWTQYFRRDFWNYLAEAKMKGAQWLNPSTETQIRLEPGPLRTLMALKQAVPDGLTSKELGPLTLKDALSDDTAQGSIGIWVKILERHGLIQANDERPKRWFYVKEYES